jgi:hypothetical protein
LRLRGACKPTFHELVCGMLMGCSRPASRARAQAGRLFGCVPHRYAPRPPAASPARHQRQAALGRCRPLAPPPPGSCGSRAAYVMAIATSAARQQWHMSPKSSTAMTCTARSPASGQPEAGGTNAAARQASCDDPTHSCPLPPPCPSCDDPRIFQPAATTLQQPGTPAACCHLPAGWLRWRLRGRSGRGAAAPPAALRPAGRRLRPAADPCGPCSQGHAAEGACRCSLTAQLRRCLACHPRQWVQAAVAGDETWTVCSLTVAAVRRR